jgi:hypothetical protein
MREEIGSYSPYGKTEESVALCMTESNGMRRRFVQAAEKVSRELSEELGSNLLAAYIYGSVARGNCRESSDVDLHIVVRDYAKVEHMPHMNWVGKIPVGVSPHPLSFYKISPEWVLRNIDVAAGWEGLWELDGVMILYDPSNLVFPFKEKITPILNNELLLKARANISFKTAMTEIAKVKRELSEAALDQAFVHMYALGGGGEEYSGAAVHVLKTVVKFSGLPLTKRRIWLRFKEACHKLNSSEIEGLLEGCYGMNRLDKKNLQEVFGKACDLINDIVTKSPVSEETIYDLEWFRLPFVEFMERAELQAALVYLLGSFSSNYLRLGSEDWQKQVRLTLEELMYKTAGLHNQRELEGRTRILQKTMDNIEKEWLS